MLWFILAVVCLAAGVALVLAAGVAPVLAAGVALVLAIFLDPRAFLVFLLLCLLWFVFD